MSPSRILCMIWPSLLGASVALAGAPPGTPAIRRLPADARLESGVGSSARIGDLTRSDHHVVLAFFSSRDRVRSRRLAAELTRFTHWAAESATTVQVFSVSTGERFRDSLARERRMARVFASPAVIFPGHLLFDPHGDLHRAAGRELPLTVFIADEGRIVESWPGLPDDLLDRLKARARLSSRARFRPRPVPPFRER